MLPGSTLLVVEHVANNQQVLRGLIQLQNIIVAAVVNNVVAQNDVARSGHLEGQRGRRLRCTAVNIKPGNFHEGCVHASTEVC